MMGAEYVPEAAGGLRWNNPAIAIKWPFAPVVISDRDASWPDFAP
jgi:dTDP-4-dehydrorhamnose 3,5-epimerase